MRKKALLPGNFSVNKSYIHGKIAARQLRHRHRKAVVFLAGRPLLVWPRGGIGCRDGALESGELAAADPTRAASLPKSCLFFCSLDKQLTRTSAQHHPPSPTPSPTTPTINRASPAARFPHVADIAAIREGPGHRACRGCPGSPMARSCATCSCVLAVPGT